MSGTRTIVQLHSFKWVEPEYQTQPYMELAVLSTALLPPSASLVAILILGVGSANNHTLCVGHQCNTLENRFNYIVDNDLMFSSKS